MHLVDGTYELFRHFYAVPAHEDARGRDVGAVRGVLSSLLSLLREGATHVGVATDHVIESFRNALWVGYKTGDGIDPALRAQFEPLEEALAAMGVAVWPMIELEADDALATAAVLAAADPAVRRVFVCTPDKDLAQSVVGERVVQLDRRRRLLLDEAGITARFGVPPTSIPDYLALVGDSADGYPGLPGWGARSSAAVLGRFRRIDAIPDDAGLWGVDVRAAQRLAAVLAGNRERALLFRKLATLRTDADVGRPPDWRWRGPTASFRALAEALRAPDLARRADELASSLA
ncbi:MAG TPA: 5'-3' exonuclease H3TH domain-containing protein [Candidatus Binatia bacterium]|nr:5'-3' exonuclease H3TH domain-containing protein [Candidatus Binatia bacterium]